MRLLLAFAAGALVPLSFSPVDLWPVALLSTAVLYVLLADAGPRRAALIGWSFGFGLFGVGASWVYVSIHDFGNAPPALAGVLTFLFVVGLGLFLALQTWLYRRLGAAKHPVLGFAATWALGEWFRSWFLTGFPWLYLGYAHVTTPLAGIAPLFGVIGISFVLALSSALSGECFLRYRKLASARALLSSHLPTLLVVLWAAAMMPRNIAWTQATGSLDVGLVQANIPQDLKFDPGARARNLDTYLKLSAPLWDKDLVIWSETAVPAVYAAEAPIVAELSALADSRGATLLTGIFGRTDDNTHNSAVVLGDGTGLWHKQKLVPFGEYVPLRALSAGLLELFELPMSSIVPGPAGQDLLAVAQHSVAPFICYEIVYPDFVRRYARDADLLVTISNDTWFGSSWGPHQHMQMSAMRALENGRWLARATNNGVSALVNERGVIVAQAPQFEETTLSGTVQLMSGRTPWSRWGNWPLLILCALLLLANFQEMPGSITGKNNKNR
jgi:apolipoprotein N-acyltransferase